MATVWQDTLGDVEATVPDVEAAKRGDRRAYARLVQRYQRLVTSITLAITTEVASSEDAAQEAFLAGWRDLSRLDNLASFGPWICQIARNRAWDIVRSRGKTVPADAEKLAEAPDPEPGALDALLESESTKLIAGALQALPEDGREAMILFYREGKSVAQVAEALAVSEDVVKKRLSRARERIRANVETALGAALIATVPGADFCTSVLGRISGPGSFPRARARRGALRFAATTAKIAGASALVVVVHRAVTAPPRTAITAFTTAAPSLPVPTGALRTNVVRPKALAEVRARIVGEKDVSGTATLDCKGDHRTVAIAHSAFAVRKLPPGPCHVTFALDGIPSPHAEDVTLEPNEIFTFTIRVQTVHPPIPGGSPVAIPPDVAPPAP